MTYRRRLGARAPTPDGVGPEGLQTGGSQDWGIGTGRAPAASLLLLLSILVALVGSCASQSGPLSPEGARLELKRRGIDYSAKALVETAKKGDTNVIKTFLDAGMDPNSRGDSGETALMQVAYSGSEAALILLLERGANVSLADDEGRTALHWAASGPFSHQCVTVLLDHGADPNARTPKGDTPLTEAVSLPLSDPSEASLLQNYIDTIKTLLDHGADVNAKNDRGIGPLVRAAIGGSPRIVRLLIERGANVRTLDNQGQTARTYALQYGHDEAARVIEQAGG